MRKNGIASLVVSFILVCALCNAIFNLGEYDFFGRLDIASHLDFNNPMDSFLKIGNKFKEFASWSSSDIEWYAYIPKFFNWLGNVLSLCFDALKNLFVTLIKIVIC